VPTSRTARAQTIAATSKYIPHFGAQPPKAPLRKYSSRRSYLSLSQKWGPLKIRICSEAARSARPTALWRLIGRGPVGGVRRQLPSARQHARNLSLDCGESASCAQPRAANANPAAGLRSAIILILKLCLELRFGRTFWAAELTGAVGAT
jgi:hypothetical protein